jgi:hypothetical protein
MKKLFKFFSLLIGNLTLQHLSGLCKETVEAARDIVNLLAPGLLKQKFTALDASTTTLLGLLYQSRANPLTEELRQLDVLIKEKLDFIKRTLTYFAQLPASPKTTAAKRLQPVFKPFWNIMAKALNDQEAGLGELRQRIASMGDYLEALTTLDLMDTWLAFTALVDQFNVLYKQRLVTNAAAAPAPSTVQDTVVTDYEAFCSVLELMLASEPTEQLKGLFKELDELRRKYAPQHRRKLDGEHTTTEPIPPQPHKNDQPILPLTRAWYQTAAGVEELIFSVDFTVTYRDNKKVGEATMILHGKGKYTGKYYTKFFIVETN